MALAGYRHSADPVIMTGWDAGELKKFQLIDNTNLEQIFNELSAGVQAVNAELASDPIWSSLVGHQDIPEIEYNVGAASNMERFNEHAPGEPVKSEAEGHMAPLLEWDHRLGWTWFYLEKRARLFRVRMDIRNGLEAARNRWRLQALGRLLQRADDSGKGKGLGNSGLSPGFATDAGSTGVDFVPPSWGGNTFDNTHEHYSAAVGGYTTAKFRAWKEHLREHGHQPPFHFLASQADEASIQALNEFTPIGSDLVAYGDAQNLARIAAGNRYAYPIGTIEDFAVYVVSGMPQYYGFGYRSYGPNNLMNPLRVRHEPGVLQPTVVAMQDPSNGYAYPLQNMMLYFAFGVGVGDRTNGIAVYTNGAAWADGTPT